MQELERHDSHVPCDTRHPDAIVGYGTDGASYVGTVIVVIRTIVDAVIVGAGTIVKDNPRLTVRAAPGKNPTRVVIDPNRRLENSKHIFTDDAAPTILIRRSGQQANASSPDGTVANGLTEIELPRDASNNDERMKEMNLQPNDSYTFYRNEIVYK